MEMNYKSENRQLTITLTGELDHHAAKGLMDSIDRCMEQNLPTKTLLDLGGLTFMDSSGIAVVLRAKRRMEALSGTLVVVNIPRQASRVLETAGLVCGFGLIRILGLLEYSYKNLAFTGSDSFTNESHHMPQGRTAAAA